MRRNPALLVALLLVAAGSAVPAGVGADATAAGETAPLIVSINETSNYLAIPEGAVERTGTSDAGLALGTALAADTYAFQSDHSQIAFEQSFRRVNTDREKTAVIRSVVDRTDRRKGALQRRDRAVIRAHANGSMTAAQFARERARITAEADRLQATIQEITRAARDDDSYSLPISVQARLANVAGELEVLQGPVSEHVTLAASGRAPVQQVYVETSSTGYTMAYVTNDSYVRETYLGKQRVDDGTDLFTKSDEPRINVLNTRGHELYPWATKGPFSPSNRALGTSGIYRFSVEFTDGELTSYIDGNTTNVFRESQRHKLSEMPTTNTITNVNGSLRLRVNKTYETGPLHVELMRNGTGVPINGSVSVDGAHAGNTGDDGGLWLVEPSGPDRITATTGDNETVGVYLPS